MTDIQGLNRDEFWKEFLARPCTLPAFQATMSDFPSEEQAREVWGCVENYLNVFGRMWNLERLYQVTLAVDYHAALAQVDRGTGTGNVVTATRDEFAEGVAMAVSILVEGTPRTHLVINAGLMSLLVKPDTRESRMALYVLAHECCHIHDLAIHDKAFPGVVLQAQLRGPQIYLNQVALACWSEYVACRLSASWGENEQTELYERTFCSWLPTVRKRGNDAIGKCRGDENYGELLSTIVTLYGNAMRYASYLLGHVAGLEREFTEVAPKAAELITANKYFQGIFWKLKNILEENWKNYGNWATEIDIFKPLEALAEEMLRIAGITLKMTPAGLYVGVPFNPEVDLRPFGTPLPTES